MERRDTVENWGYDNQDRGAAGKYGGRHVNCGKSCSISRGGKTLLYIVRKLWCDVVVGVM